MEPTVKKFTTHIVYDIFLCSFLGLKSDPPEGIEALPLDKKSCHWMATITGPVGSPYEGGIFYLYLQVPYR